MFRIYTLILFSLLLFAGCGTDASDNTGTAGDGSEELNQQKVELEKEVPTFNDAPTALKRGIEYLDANYIEQAINALKQAVKLDEDLADAHFQLGVALSLRESADEKTITLEEAAESKPSKSKNTEKTESEIAFENAVKAYKKIIAKNKEDHAAYYNLGRSYIKLYDDTNARKALEQAVKLNGEDTLYRTELGAVLIKLAQYPSAIRQLDKAVEIDASNYRAEDLLVKARAGKKRVDHGQKEKPLTSTTSSTSTPDAGPATPSVDTRERVVPKPKTEPKPPPPLPKPTKPAAPAA